MDYIEFKARVRPLLVGREILIAELSEIDFESFVETELGLEAYIQKNNFNEKVLKELSILNNQEFEIDYQLKNIKDQNWNEVWEQNFDPINVEDKCYVRAPFHKAKEEVEFDIVIEPKMSFGTGHHETTFLMIKKLLNMDLESKNVLDMGCGTGVLAILAKLKKADKVVAIDIDEWAYNNTVENVEKNNTLDILVKLGGAELLKNEKFNLVIANINRNILLQDMANYVNVLEQKGSLLLSGFFSSDQNVIIEETSKYNLKLISKDIKNDWTMLHFQKG